MNDQIEAQVTIHPAVGQNIPNFTIEGARFFGKPNFSGEMDRFKDDRRKCTIIIPEAAVEPLRQLGYNVKTMIPDEEGVEAGRETINHLKVMVDVKTSDVWVIQGESREKLNENTLGIIDRSRFEAMDLEVRGWMYNKEEVDAGKETPEYSARLVTFIGVMRSSALAEKYGNLR